MNLLHTFLDGLDILKLSSVIISNEEDIKLLLSSELVPTNVEIDCISFHKSDEVEYHIENMGSLGHHKTSKLPIYKDWYYSFTYY